MMKKWLSLLLCLCILPLFAFAAATEEDNAAAAAQPAPPDGVFEYDITVVADDNFPLPGTLTLPEEDPRAGFVLVHGSGANNRDEQIGPNRPFRDLAWGLAQQGFAVLRYDKRTMVYPEPFIWTVDEETAIDAAAAVHLMGGVPGMEDKKIFIMGHSMGAMLASYVGSFTQDADGYVLLAGTPRKLWQILVDQNYLALAELPEAQRPDMEAMIESEHQKGLGLKDLGDEEVWVTDNIPFAMSGWYTRHFEYIDAPKLHLEDQLPVLVVHGESDRQVFMKDFELWKATLKEHPDATFKSYPGVNHLLGKYQGKEPPFSQLFSVEYMQLTPVPQEIIDDIAAWAKERL